MRGYRLLRETGRLDLINQIRHELENTPLSSRPLPVSETFFPDALSIAEKVVSQYLIVRLVSFPFNRGVLASLVSPGRFNIHVLPAAWRAVLKKNDVPISSLASMIAWWCTLLAAWVYGSARVVSLLYKTRPISIATATSGLHGTADFDALSLRNKPREEGPSHDILTWYASRAGRDGQVTSITHNVAAMAPLTIEGLPVRFADSGLPRFTEWSQTGRFLLWSGGAIARAFAGLLIGRWWHALLLSEAGKAAVAAIHDPQSLAREYWFHNSGHIYRPLWTYPAETGGARIGLYCYATNFSDFKRPDGYPLQSGNWSLMSWNNYTVWDSYQKAFIERAVGGEVEIDIAGEIPFADSDESLPAIRPGSIAVFDVQPVRESYYRSLGQRLEYYTPKNSSSFLIDVEAACQNCGLIMLLKRKREIGKLAHPLYKGLIKKISGNSANLVAINPDIAAHRVIEAADMVISMPFTSTAMIGRKLGKPSCFYDAHGLIEFDDRAAHGIPVIRGREALIEWVRSQKTGQVPERNNKQ